MDKKARKAKIESLQESISKTETLITILKAEGNTRAVKVQETVLKCFNSKLNSLKK